MGVSSDIKKGKRCMNGSLGMEWMVRSPYCRRRVCRRSLSNECFPVPSSTVTCEDKYKKQVHYFGMWLFHLLCLLRRLAAFVPVHRSQHSVSSYKAWKGRSHFKYGKKKKSRLYNLRFFRSALGWIALLNVFWRSKGTGNGLHWIHRKLLLIPSIDF